MVSQCWYHCILFLSLCPWFNLGSSNIGCIVFVSYTHCASFSFCCFHGTDCYWCGDVIPCFDAVGSNTNIGKLFCICLDAIAWIYYGIWAIVCQSMEDMEVNTINH